MIYKILDKEEIGELKEELSCGLPGTAKVYIYRHCLCFELLVSIFMILSMYSIEITVPVVTKYIFFFLIMFFKPDQEAKKKGEK